MKYEITPRPAYYYPKYEDWLMEDLSLAYKLWKDEYKIKTLIDEVIYRMGYDYPDLAPTHVFNRAVTILEVLIDG